MARPVRYDFEGDRGIQFNDTITFVGVDYTGDAKRAQVRITPDAPGLLTTFTVTQTYAGTATVETHIAAGRLPLEIYGYKNPLTSANYAPTDNVLLTVVAFQLAANRMVDPYIPNAEETGDNVTVAYDLLITIGGVEQKIAYGAFLVRGTVTQ